MQNKFKNKMKPNILYSSSKFLVFIILFIYFSFQLLKLFIKYNEENINYYFMHYIISSINIIKNNIFQQIMYDLFNSTYKIKESPLYSMCKYRDISLDKYNKQIEINYINEYTVLKFDIRSKSLKNMAFESLQNIVNSQLICLNSIPIEINQCVIVDVFNTSLTKFAAFHTYIEYSNFTGDAFNVWYLTENNEDCGNMFLLESSDYKKEYTPCFLKDYDSNNCFPIMKQSYINELVQNNHEQIGIMDKNNLKIFYASLKNGECLIMSKHLLHRTDITRNKNFKGFNFRVIIKNKDGSINYKNKYKKIKPYHIYDEKKCKIFGVKLLDFI
jgi:hypothetical protein